MIFRHPLTGAFATGGRRKAKALRRTSHDHAGLESRRVSRTSAASNHSGAGTSRAGGAIAQEDALIICLSKMARVLDVNFPNRTMRVEAGITNLKISEHVMPEGFFYAPDPSSQLACTIGGNVGMNSGGAHCLKYGVTTNNILGVRMVMIDGTIVDIGSDALDAPGLDLEERARRQPIGLPVGRRQAFVRHEILAEHGELGGGAVSPAAPDSGVSGDR